MNILVDRHNEQGDIGAFRNMIKVIDDGNPLFIFPEGTITKNAPKMGEFKVGAISLALKKQIPILPITFLNNWRRVERKGFFKGLAGPGTAKVIVHKPLGADQIKKLGVKEANAFLKEIIGAPLSIEN